MKDITGNWQLATGNRQVGYYYLRNIYIFQSYIIFLFILMLSSCKEPDEVALKQITGDKLNVLFTDTTAISAFSLREDSIKTNYTAYNLAGNINDPIFGKTNAGFYTQFQITNTNVSFGTDPILDSLVLTLAYSGHYGDTNSTQTFSVYELEDALSSSKNYYSYFNNSKNNTLKYYPTKIGSKIFYPHPKDSLTVDSHKLAAHLRITLSSEFANKILKASTTDLANNTGFLNFFKGIYIAADSLNTNRGAILYFNLYSSDSKMTLYYHHPDNKSDSYDFVINTNCIRFNTFNHFSYTNANNDLRNIINDTILAKQSGEKNLYLQSMGGIKTKIEFPDIANLFGSQKVAINKAELVIKINPTEPLNDSYSVPQKLSLLRINSEGKTILPPDYAEGAAYFGGTYNSTKKEYRFSLTIYIQGLLTDYYLGDKGLFLSIDGASSLADRVLLKGPKYELLEADKRNNNLKLEITYTPLGHK